MIGGGTAVATFTAGLLVERTESVGLACRIDLHNLPREVKNNNTLREFVLKQLRDYDSKHRSVDGNHTIRWTRFYSGDEQLQRQRANQDDFADDGQAVSRGIVVFATDNSANAAREQLARYIPRDADDAKQSRRDRIATNETWGRSVLWKCSQDIDLAGAKKYLGQNSGLLQITPTRLFGGSVPFIEKKDPSFQISITNLPLGTTPRDLRRVLDSNLDVFIKIFEPKYNVTKAFLNFKSAELRNRGLTQLQQSPLASTYVTLTLPKSTHTKQPLFSIDPTRDKAGIWTYELLFQTVDHAASFIRSTGDASAKGFAQLDVKHGLLFDLPSMCDAIAIKVGVDVSRYSLTSRENESKHNSSSQVIDSTRIVFTGASSSACGQACQSLLVSIAPLRVIVSNQEQRLMLQELDTSKQLSRWETELGVKLQYFRSPDKFSTGPRKDRLRGLIIHGEGGKQGHFMRLIGEYATDFSKRYMLLKLGDNAGLFRPGKAGHSVLLKIQKQFQTECVIEYDRSSEAIQVYVNASVSAGRVSEICDQCSIMIDEILFASSKGKVMGSHSAEKCGYCGMKSDLTFSICGHASC